MITLIEGSTLCLSSTSGDILPDRSQGLFVSDTRVISGWRVHVEGMAAEPLTTLDGDRYRATFVGRIPPRRGRADSALMALRTRYVGDGMREDIVLRNVGAEAAGILVTVAVDADFADLFEVKECRVIPAGGVGVDLGANRLTYTPFGRDSLLTGWMALPLDQQRALGTLRTSAEFQGAADATPLFVALLGELHRWGSPGAELHALLPAADRALSWLETYGDIDGDGFVEYHRTTDRGLLQRHHLEVEILIVIACLLEGAAS
jgi:glycogen debranching enzyme